VFGLGVADGVGLGVEIVVELAVAGVVPALVSRSGALPHAVPISATISERTTASTERQITLLGVADANPTAHILPDFAALSQTKG